MRSLFPLGSHLGHWIVAALIASTLLFAYRWINRRSPLLGTIFGLGLVCRVFAGLLLFSISYLDLPVASGLHSGDGFWDLAGDARTYYWSAIRAHEEGLSVISSSAGSPIYVKTLTIWMHLVGVSPAAGLFLNLMLFSALCLLLVRSWGPRGGSRDDLPCAVTIAAFAVSPSMLIHGSQSMKEDLFAFLIAMTAFSTLRLFDPRAHRSWMRDAVACLGIAACVFMVSGIRSYFGMMLWTCLALGFVTAVIEARKRGAARVFGAALLTLGLSWYGYKSASGTYYWNPVHTALTEPAPVVVAAAPPPVVVAPPAAPPGTPPPPSATRSAPRGSGRGEATTTPAPTPAPPPVQTPAPVTPAAPPPAPVPKEPGVIERTGALFARVNELLVERLRFARRGFELSGGATNLVVERKGTGLPGEGRVLAYGLMTMLVPVTLLKGLGLVEFDGGRGLLLLADVDTVFLDAAILATLFFLRRHWSTARQRLPYVTFIGGLAVVSTALLGYVVTNYGTLFRLRAMMAVPFLLLVLAIGRGKPGAGDRPEPDRGP